MTSTIDGPALVLSVREAYLLSRAADLGRLRLARRGEDPEVDGVLYAVTAFAEQWRPDLVSDVGNEGDDSAETGGCSPAMTTSDVADIADCTTRTVRYAAERGQLVGTQTSGAWMFTADAVRDWTATRKAA